MLDQRIEKCDISDLDFNEEYEQCTFVECDLSKQDLSERKFIDCRFEDCDLSNATLNNTALREVHFKNCKLLGLFFEQCNPFGLELSFEHCVLDHSSFHGVNLPQTTFTQCRLIDVDLSNADLSESEFNDCDLQGTVFDRTNCEGADLSTSVNILLDPDINRLKHARFSLSSLPGLLYKHQIDIV